MLVIDKIQNCTPLKCFFSNARGLLSKIDLLRDLSVTEELDIIGIVETFLNETILDAEIYLKGYRMYRKDRDSIRNNRGGGVILYVNEEIVSQEIEYLNSVKCESVWSELVISKSCRLSVGVCYKNPTIEDWELNNLYSVIQQASVHQTMIMGDFNFPSIDWQTLEADGRGTEFRDLIIDNCLSQHVLEPTREGNILDLIITSSSDMIDQVVISEHLGKSDHYSLRWKLSYSVDRATVQANRRNFHKAKYVEMQKWLAEIKWLELFNELHVENMWTTFCNTVETAVKLFVPIDSNKSRKFPRWMNRKARRARNVKVNMWKKYAETRTYNDYVEYKIARNRANREFKSAKRRFEKRLCNNIKNNPKGFYSYVRSCTSFKATVGPLVDSEGLTVSDNKSMSRILNDYFQSVFTAEAGIENIPDVEPKLAADSGMSDIEVSQPMIENKLRKLKPGKSPGVDKIASRMMKECASELSFPLSILFNESVQSGTVPVDWRSANVTAIYKKGPRTQPSNYRPISLTSHVCKVFESVIRDQIVIHLSKFKLIGDSQHGFVTKRSCLTNLLEFLDFVTNYVDKGLAVDVIFLDFQKAFDKVPHQRLMKIVESMGISGNLLNWIRSWLTDRKQRVVLGGECSEWVAVTSGVPQGSVLGPLLFLIYINNLENSLDANILKFADDTKIFNVINNREDAAKLQNELYTLFGWFQCWLMLFNIEKCMTMHFGLRNICADYEINGVQLKNVNEEKDLGVIIQNNLKWNVQCAQAVNKASRVLGMVKRTFNCLDIDMFKTLYCSLVRPHLEFCVQAWSPHLKKDRDLIERVQRTATKLVKSLTNEPYEVRLRMLGLTTLETRRLRGDLIETFKILRGFENVDASRYFIRAHSVTRGHELKLVKPACRLDCRKFFFSHRVVDTWNGLPNEVVTCSSVNAFKNSLDKH